MCRKHIDVHRLMLATVYFFLSADKPRHLRSTLREMSKARRPLKLKVTWAVPSHITSESVQEKQLDRSFIFLNLSLIQQFCVPNGASKNISTEIVLLPVFTDNQLGKAFDWFRGRHSRHWLAKGDSGWEVAALPDENHYHGSGSDTVHT